MRRSSPEIIEIVMNVSLALRLAAKVLACACECETRGASDGASLAEHGKAKCECIASG